MVLKGKGLKVLTGFMWVRTRQGISSSSSYICHGVGPLVDPFRFHVSRSLFKGLAWFLLPVGE
jgi:hypothetical protein